MTWNLLKILLFALPWTQSDISWAESRWTREIDVFHNHTKSDSDRAGVRKQTEERGLWDLFREPKGWRMFPTKLQIMNVVSELWEGVSLSRCQLLLLPWETEM